MVCTTTPVAIKCEVTSVYTDVSLITDVREDFIASAVEANEAKTIETPRSGSVATSLSPEPTRDSDTVQPMTVVSKPTPHDVLKTVDKTTPTVGKTTPTVGKTTPTVGKTTPTVSKTTAAPVSASPSIKVEFLLEWKSFKWNTPTGIQHTISRDIPPLVTRVICSNNKEMSHTNTPYKQGGTLVSYDITPTPTGVPYDTKSQTNPYLQTAAVGVVDTIKVNLFSKRPDTPMTMIPKDATTKPVSVADRPNDLHIHLAGGWVAMEELAKCMKGNAGGTVLNKEFSHNFTPMCLNVQFSEAVVTIDGVRHTDGPTLLTALAGHLKTGRLMPSAMRSMHNRAQVLVCGAKIVGAATAAKCAVRANSIGNLMHQPISLGMQQGEVIPIAMMGDMYKSHIDPVCPVMAVHFAAHAMNICALPAWNANTGPPIRLGTNKDTMCTPPRIFTTPELVNLVHTTLQGPAYSSELSPYTSDLVMDISQDTVEKMRNGTFTKFEAKDTKLSECIDAMHSVPNGTSCFRADDCEGTAAATMMMQHNLRASFYDGAEYLRCCDTDKGITDMSKWIQSKQFCNVKLKPEEEYAFAVNLVVLGAVSHLAFDAKLLIIGAMCATPLVPVELTQEQGHAASIGRVFTSAIPDISSTVYAHYANPETRFTLLKLPQLQGVTAIGRPANAEAVHLAGDYAIDVQSVTLARPSPNFEGLATTKSMPMGCDVLQAAFDDNYPCVNVTPLHADNPCYQFLMIESTTSLHSCPVRGYVSAARMNAVTAKNNPAAVPVPTGVPIEQFLKTVQCGFIKPYLTVAEDVRLEGFSHIEADPDMPAAGTAAKPKPDFYQSFYQMDSFSLNTVQNDGTIFIGASARQILNSAHSTTACTTMEPTAIPIITAEENVDIKNAMMAQWDETRLPFIGMPALRNMLASWYPATVSGDYYPDDEIVGIMRCNVAISGSNAEKLFTDMSPGGAMYMARDVSNGLIAQQHAIRMGCCTTIASQAIRTKHFNV